MEWKSPRIIVHPWKRHSAFFFIYFSIGNGIRDVGALYRVFRFSLYVCECQTIREICKSFLYFYEFHDIFRMSSLHSAILAINKYLPYIDSRMLFEYNNIRHRGKRWIWLVLYVYEWAATLWSYDGCGMAAQPCAHILHTSTASFILYTIFLRGCHFHAHSFSPCLSLHHVKVIFVD